MCVPAMQSACTFQVARPLSYSPVRSGRAVSEKSLARQRTRASTVDVALDGIKFRAYPIWYRSEARREVATYSTRNSL